MTPWDQAILVAYYSVLIALSIFGLHRYALVYLYYKHRHRVHDPEQPFGDLPRVLVQLPIFNEATVVERLIEAVCAIDYPRDRLEIQLLDDSTDETVDIAQQAVALARSEGHQIEYIHRVERTGFKAGALEAGLDRSVAPFVAIFDADFIPSRDILRRVIDHFTDAKVGMVQVRWGHINRRFSLLTRLQSIFLDGHFVIEHTARNRSGRFFNFNGTAGIWRRDCIVDAGGWQHDTLTEDLDLSYRAQLKGWDFVFVPDVISPAELPVEMNAFKSQQHRWAKGSIQVCRKLLPTIWRAEIPLKTKIEATFHLTNNVAYVLILVLSALMLPALLARLADTNQLRGFLFDASLFIAASASVISFYVASQREAYRDWRESIKYFPALLALGIGISVNNAKAVIEAMMGMQSPFVRTPKYNVRELESDSYAGRHGFRYVGTKQGLPLVEIALGVYFTAIVLIAFHHHLVITGLFLSLFQAGFLWVGISSARPSRRDLPSSAPVAA